MYVRDLDSGVKKTLIHKDLDNILQPLHSSMFVESNPSPVKYAASLLNLAPEDVRLPLVKVRDKTKKIIKESLQAAKLL